MPFSKTSGLRDLSKKITLMPLQRRAIQTRSQNIQENVEPIITRGKRKAESNSPLKNDKVKRSALGNLTNNGVNVQIDNDHGKKKSGVLKASQSDVTNKITNNINVKKTISFRGKNDKNSESISNSTYQNATNGIVLRGNKVITREQTAVKNNNIVPLSVMHNHLVAADSSKLNNKNNHHKYKTNETVIKPKEIYEVAVAAATTAKPSRRISNDFNKTETEDSLYMSALEDLPSSGDSLRFSGQFKNDLKRKSLTKNTNDNIKKDDLKRKSLTKNTKDKKDSNLLVTINEHIYNRLLTPSPPLKDPIELPPTGVVDIDKDNWNDPLQVSEYAMDIFNYLKKREVEFPMDDYMARQTNLTVFMRSLLIDWMVEIQEQFELNHEALYLAVKLVDMYLMRKDVHKDDLQLLGATSLFIACKYDERTPPLADDFMYACDGAYEHKELIKMEISVLKIVGFDLGIPISYRFLRRYARSINMELPHLTLARYILELSLLDYSTIMLSDSQLACAALFIALKMNDPNNTESPWNKTLEYFTGYVLEDFAYIVEKLNTGLHRKPKESIKTIRKKYSHRIFFEVAKTPLLTIEKLLENTELLISDKLPK